MNHEQRKSVIMSKSQTSILIVITNVIIFLTIAIINIEVFKSLMIALAGLFCILVTILIFSDMAYLIYNAFKVTKELQDTTVEDKEKQSGVKVVSEATITLAEIFLKKTDDDKEKTSCK